jgi:hypothetical protein
MQKKEEATLEELRRDLFLRRKRRQKFRDFNNEREDDRKNVERIMNSQIPIKKSMLLKDNKSMSRKQTRISLKMKELGLSPSIDAQHTLTDMDTLDRDSELRSKMLMKKQLKNYNMPQGSMTGFQAEIILSRILQKEPDATYEGLWRDCAQ